MTWIWAWGQCSAHASARVLTMPALVRKRSSRVMPGFRGCRQRAPGAFTGRGCSGDARRAAQDREPAYHSRGDDDDLAALQGVRELLGAREMGHLRRRVDVGQIRGDARHRRHIWRRRESGRDTTGRAGAQAARPGCEKHQVQGRDLRASSAPSHRTRPPSSPYRFRVDTSGSILTRRARGWPIPPPAPKMATLWACAGRGGAQSAHTVQRISF